MNHKGLALCQTTILVPCVSDLTYSLTRHIDFLVKTTSTRQPNRFYPSVSAPPNLDSRNLLGVRHSSERLGYVHNKFSLGLLGAKLLFQPCTRASQGNPSYKVGNTYYYCILVWYTSGVTALSYSGWPVLWTVSFICILYVCDVLCCEIKLLMFNKISPCVALRRARLPQRRHMWHKNSANKNIGIFLNLKIVN
jgi:hypothetical protein